MQLSPTQSRERVKGETPLQGQGAAPLVGFGATPQLFRGRPAFQTRSTKGAGSEASLPVTLRSRRSAPSGSTHYLHIVAPNGRDHIAAPPHLALAFPSKRIPKPKKIQEKPAAQNRWFFQSPEIFTSSAPPDESAGTSARSPQTRTLWGAVHAARDSAPTGRSKAECSAPATIG